MMILLLYNSVSGAGLGMREAQNAAFYLEQKQISFQSFCDQWPFSFKPDEEVWLFGGDGTLNFFLNTYGLIDNPIAIFAGGTGNDVHTKLYGAISTLQLCEFLLQSAVPTKTDVAMCNNEYFINGVGIGFDGEVLKGMHKIRKLGGHLGYLLQVLKVVFSYKEVTYQMSFNGKSESESLLLLNVANSDRTGGGFRISPLANMHDGKLNLLRCDALPVYKRLRYLPVIQKGKHLELSFIAHETVGTIQIKASERVAYQLDGELREAKDFEISLCEQGVFLLC